MEISLGNIKKTFSYILHRYHILLFVIFILGGLVFAELSLNFIITRSADISKYSSAANADTTFDQATIDRLNKLKTRNEAPTPLNFSAGRTSPFVE